MSATALGADLQALGDAALAHQKAGRFAEAAQAYAALLSRAPQLWPACYNLGLVYQHLQRLPEAADMYARAVRLNPQLAEGFNNLGNVLKALKNDREAIEAYQHALALNPQLAESSYNLAMLLEAGGDRDASLAALRQAVTSNPAHGNAWDALYRGLLGQTRQEEALQAFLDWENAAEASPERVIAGLALCRPLGDRARESRYLALAIAWPFETFTPEQYAPILGMIQYFDLDREALLGCYRRYDEAVAARRPAIIPLLPRRAADARLRIGYVSGDFRQHVMGRMLLDVIARHDRSRFSILLISTCAREQHDALTAAFQRSADGFADVSAQDDFAAAKSIAEADIDVLVDLAGHTNSARPGIYAHRPARSLVTHLGYHGCLGTRAIDFKLTDRIADLADAAAYQIESPFVLEGCVFPLARVALPSAAGELDQPPGLSGKFVFGVFLNLLKLSPRCLAVWRRVLEAAPDAVLLFSPLDPGGRLAIERVTSAAGIDPARIAILEVTQRDEASLRARYRMVDAVLDTFPYAGGDTTLAALDRGVPVVTLAGERHSERIGASILTHLGVPELVAASEQEYLATASRLVQDREFMTAVRQKIAAGTAAAAAHPDAYTRSLENAFLAIAAHKPAAVMQLTARQFFQTLHEAMRRQRAAGDDDERRAIAAVFAELRREQPDYPPLLRAQGELAQALNDLQLAGDCLAAFLMQCPDDIDARLALAAFLIDQNAAAEALKVIDDAPLPADSNLRMLKLQTRACCQLRQWEDARRHSARAVELGPADVQALFWHGTVLSQLGEIEAALTVLNRTLILAPDHAEAAYNAGVLLAELGNHADAEKVFRRALGTSAARPAHLRLLHTLRAARRQPEWLAEAQRFADTYSTSDYSRWLESRLARHGGDLDREAQILLPLAERATVLENDVAAVELIGELLAVLPCHDVSPRLLQRLQQRFTEALAVLHPSSATSPPRREAPGSRRLNIGYVVDFSLPFLAEWIVGLAAHYDRTRFAMTVYVVSPAGTVPRAPLEGAGVEVISLTALGELRGADKIRDGQMDLLVDASGFGAYAKPGMLSHRPVALQLGLPGLTRPTAAGALDFRLSDRELELAPAADSLRPAPRFVDGCVLPLLAARPAKTSLTRAMLGLGEDLPVFGLLASIEHYSLRNSVLWKALADRLPEALFLVCPLDSGDAVPARKILFAAGIGAGRIRLLPAAFQRPRDLSLAGLIDVILDPVPGSDYVSARAALIETIPIVTMPGRMPDERVALAMLSHLRETSTVAATGLDYVDIAARLASSREQRDNWSARLRERWQDALPAAMPLSLQAVARQLEAALLGAVEESMPADAGAGSGS